MVKFFPEPIGSVVNLPIPVAYVYPPRGSDVGKAERKQKRQVLRQVGVKSDNGDEA